MRLRTAAKRAATHRRPSETAEPTREDISESPWNKTMAPARTAGVPEMSPILCFSTLVLSSETIARLGPRRRLHSIFKQDFRGLDRFVV